jgi:hypothetical protein
MYIWKTKLLSHAIRDNELTDSDWKKYYLAGSLFLMTSMYLSTLTPRTNIPAVLLELVLLIGVTIFGISITFGTNQDNGGNGENYISRVTALSFPLLVKIFSVSLLFGVVVGVFGEAGTLSQQVQEWLFTIFTLLIQIVFFWRINTHLTTINHTS